MATGPKQRTDRNRRASKARKVVTYPVPRSLDDRGREEFRRLVGALKARGTLDRADIRVVELAAAAYSELLTMQGQVRADGMTCKAANGTLIPHPLLGMVGRTATRLRGHLNDLGLSPKSSKHGGQTVGQAPSDEWEGLLNVVG